MFGNKKEKDLFVKVMESPGIFSRIYKQLTTGSVEKDPNPIKMGILGAANIAPNALIHPAHYHPHVIVHGVAARDKAKGEAYARKHKIPKLYDSYEALLQDPEITAVYIPTPNGLHLKWTLLALQAGKHVLLEKPIANNEKEAEEIAKETQTSGLVCMEAFHYRYHPAGIRTREIVQSGEIGEVKSFYARLAAPSFTFSDNDIRFNLELGGGSMMDMGCYTVNCMRYFIGAEPLECISAVATPSTKVCGVKNEEEKKQVDSAMIAEFKFANGAIAKTDCNLMASLFQTFPYVEIVGSKGKVTLNNFIFPSVYHSIVVEAEGASRTEKRYGNGLSTYYHQLDAFVAAIKEKRGFPTTTEDGVLNMKVIDMTYRKAGLKPRGQIDQEVSSGEKEREERQEREEEKEEEEKS